MLLCQFQRSSPCLSPEINEVYMSSLKQNDLPQCAERHSCVTAPPDPPLPFSLPGFLGQQQHPVCGVGVSSSPRLVQSPPECPFPAIRTAQRPSNPWLRQKASSAANQHLNGAHGMQMRMPRGQQGTYSPLQEHHPTLCLGSFPLQEGRAPSPRDAQPQRALLSLGCMQVVTWEHCARLAVLALLAAPAAVRGVSDFQLLPHLSGYPRKGGRALGAFRSFKHSAAKAKRPQGLGRCEYIHCVDKEMIKSSIFRNQFAYVNTET